MISLSLFACLLSPKKRNECDPAPGERGFSYWHLRGLVPLPVPAPVHRGRLRESQAKESPNLTAVGLAAMIFPPRHFGGIAAQIQSADMVMLPPFGAAQAGEEAFGQIGAGPIQAVGHLMIDPFHLIAGVQIVP